MLLLRNKSQDPSSLARQIYEEGKSRGGPGLGKEVTQICSEKLFYKVNGYKDDDFSKVQDYSQEKSVANTRMALKVRSKMV